jgi:hypothetical protein
MRVGNRYRWEFRLAAGETADDYRDMARLHPLISPWTKSIPAAQLQMSGSPSTPSARRSPTAGETAGSSCSATPRTSHHPSSARAWARGDSRCDEPGLEAGRGPGRHPARGGAGHLPARAQAARPSADPAGQADRSGHDGRRRARQPAAGPGPPAAPDPRAPKPASSPWMRRYPQVGFSEAKRFTSTRRPVGVDGRPGGRVAVVVHRRATRCRCHPRIVPA